MDQFDIVRATLLACGLPDIRDGCPPVLEVTTSDSRMAANQIVSFRAKDSPVPKVEDLAVVARLAVQAAESKSAPAAGRVVMRMSPAGCCC
jgi:hypothetical protein